MSVCYVCGSRVAELDGTCPSCGANLTSVYLPENTPLNGYTFGRMLGQGGFGITYLALQGNQTVAIKEFFPDGSQRIQGRVIPPSGLSEADFVQAKTNFLEETQVLQSLMQGQNSPYIVDVYSTFEANNTVYMVMEYLEGETLETRILRKGKLKAKEVREIARQLCTALEIVHGAGLLHRDIKPANVFLSNDARVVLIDFGSARVFKTGQTMRHTRMVTPGYAPLEQYSSEARVSAATDVYALSATLYHALTGVMPPTAIDRMNGATFAPLTQQMSEGLRQAITKGLSLQMADRPADAKAFSRLVFQPNPPPVPKAPPKKPKKLPTNPKPPRVVVTPARAAAAQRVSGGNFSKYNPDFLAFLCLGALIFGSYLMLGELDFLPFLETALIGTFRMTLLLLAAWGFTWLLELPLGFVRGFRKPLGVVRRFLIVGLAILVIHLLQLVVATPLNTPASFSSVPWLAVIGLVYVLLWWTYRYYPSQSQTIERHHWWDAFWLVCIGLLLDALQIWTW